LTLISLEHFGHFISFFDYKDTNIFLVSNAENLGEICTPNGSVVCDVRLEDETLEKKIFQALAKIRKNLCPNCLENF
jgi:hypothetical protein